MAPDTVSNVLQTMLGRNTVTIVFQAVLGHNIVSKVLQAARGTIQYLMPYRQRAAQYSI